MDTNPPSPNHKMFAVYHYHEYESTQWVLWSEVFPTEEQIVETLDIDFQPEKGEYIDIDEITEINTLELS